MSTILIVDDDPIMGLLYKSVLGQAGYKLAMAHSGEEALELIPTVKPDLIFLDVMMPGIDGYETLREMEKRKLANVPVIVITGNVKEYHVSREHARLTGASGFLHKPFNKAQLLEEVWRWLPTPE